MKPFGSPIVYLRNSISKMSGDTLIDPVLKPGDFLPQDEIPLADYFGVSRRLVSRLLDDFPFLESGEIIDVQGYRCVALIGGKRRVPAGSRCPAFSDEAFLYAAFPQAEETYEAPQDFPVANGYPVLVTTEFRHEFSRSRDYRHASPAHLRKWLQAPPSSGTGARLREQLYALFHEALVREFIDRVLVRSNVLERKHIPPSLRSLRLDLCGRDSDEEGYGVSGFFSPLKAFTQARWDSFAEARLLGDLARAPTARNLCRALQALAKRVGAELIQTSLGAELREHCVRDQVRPADVHWGVSADWQAHTVAELWQTDMSRYNDARWWRGFHSAPQAEEGDLVPFLEFRHGLSLPDTLPWELALRILFIRYVWSSGMDPLQRVTWVRLHARRTDVYRHILIPKRQAIWFRTSVSIPPGAVERGRALERFYVLSLPVKSAIKAAIADLSAGHKAAPCSETDIRLPVLPEA